MSFVHFFLSLLLIHLFINAFNFLSLSLSFYSFYSFFFHTNFPFFILGSFIYFTTISFSFFFSTPFIFSLANILFVHSFSLFFILLLFFPLLIFFSLFHSLLSFSFYSFHSSSFPHNFLFLFLSLKLFHSPDTVHSFVYLYLYLFSTRFFFRFPALSIHWVEEYSSNLATLLNKTLDIFTLLCNSLISATPTHTNASNTIKHSTSVSTVIIL